MAQDISKNLWALVLSAWIASRAAIIFFGKDPREVSQRFASENAFYYSFYSQLLSESPWKLWEDRLSEAPSAILALRRFNIYQELCFGLLFQGLQGIFGESISPASFYCLCVFIVYGLGLWAFFGSLETSAEVIFCGALYLSSFQACTHVAFMPPLRENCALPFWFCSMKVLQEMYRNEDKVRWSQRVLFLTSVTSFLLLWQFACFALLLQVLIIYALLLLDIVSASFVSMVSRLYVSSVILSFGLRFGDLWSLRSPFFSMALVFCFVHRLGSWRLRVLLPVAVIVLHYLWPSSNEDDSHITAFLIFRIKAVLHDILGVGVAPEASYHVALYAGQRSFSPPSLAELRQLVLLAGAIAFLRIPCLPREQRFLNALRGLLALAVAPLYLLMMRYQMLFFPHMALLGASLVTVLPKSLRLATAVGLLAISDPFISGQPDPGPTQETEDQVERGLLMAWMRNHTSPNDIIVAGMGMSALVRMHSLRGIVCHPHYESAELRERCFWAEKLHGHRTLEEYHRILRDRLLKGVDRTVFVALAVKDCFSINEARQQISQLVEMDEPWRWRLPKTCDLLYRLAGEKDIGFFGFQPRWLGRWFAVLQLLPEHQRGRAHSFKNARARCSFGRYFYEEVGEPNLAAPYLQRVPADSWRRLPVECGCAAEVFGPHEEIHVAHSLALEAASSDGFGCCVLGPKILKCLSDKAFRLLHQGQAAPLAELYFRKAAELFPESAQAVGFLGFARLQAGMAFEALRTFNETLRLEGERMTGTSKCGEATAFANLGDWPRAQSALQRAMQLDGRCEEHLKGLLWISTQPTAMAQIPGYDQLQDAWASVATAEGWRSFLKSSEHLVQEELRPRPGSTKVLFLGQQHHLPSVLKSLRILREVHQLSWPAEFWTEAADIATFEAPLRRDSLRELRMDLRSVALPQARFPLQHNYWRWQAHFAQRFGQNAISVSRLRAYALKPLILLLSGCDVCLFLDADNVALKPPQDLLRFLQDATRSAPLGAVFWPDLWPKPRRNWRAEAAEAVATASQESGQLLVNKSMDQVRKALLLSTLFAVRWDLFLEVIYTTDQGDLMCGFGDKDVYQAAFEELGVPFRMMAPRPALLVHQQRYAGLLQLDDQNQSFFAHVSAAKGEMWDLLEAGALQRCDLSEAASKSVSCSSWGGHGSMHIPMDELRCTALKGPAPLSRGHIGSNDVRANRADMADTGDGEELASLRGRGRGRGKRRKSRGGGSVQGSTAKAAPGMPPKTLEAQHSLSSNIQGLRFMQSARENEERKKMENEKLRHFEDMQWVIPGFEAEVEAETRQEKRAPEAQATASTVLLHRRSYKGFNGMVEQAMKDLLKKHAQAKAQDEEVEQAKTLRKMKQQRTKA